MENKNDCSIARWLADVFRCDDTGKIEVYTAAYREAWKKTQDKPPEPPGKDLSENAYQDTRGTAKMAITARNRRSGRAGDLPHRKPDCKFYSRCLDKAARQDANLSCSECARYHRQPFQHIDNVQELRPYLCLMHELFGAKAK
jgi:hypothetical protein